MNLKIKGHKVTLNGNKLTGDTYPVKLYIKEYLAGKWNAESKSWTVDLDAVERFSTCQYPAIVVDDSAPTTQAKVGNLSAWKVNTKYGPELGEDY